MGGPAGIETAKVTDWFVEHVAGTAPPLRFDPVIGGRSNLTYVVTDGAGQKSVLRRPPVSHLLPTAHDMNREQTIISALADTDVPVPAVLGYCADPEVTGQPFYVMEFVDGLVLRSALVAEALSPAERTRIADSLVDVLARLHAVDPDAVGLGQLSRKEGYLARQLKRWHGQFTASKTREVPLVDELHGWLSARMPEQGPATIVHGDYRLDNTIVGPEGIRAVLDWELCTLGDRYLDLAMMLVYWRDPGERVRPDEVAAASILEGFPRKHELAALYAERAGADLGRLDYYSAFAYWRLACIADGVYARYRAGAMGDDRSYPAVDPVPDLARAARDAAERSGL